MKRVVCENTSGETIEFTYSGYPLRLSDTSGFSSAEYTVNTSQNSGQDGVNYNSTTANKRNPVITADIFSDYQTYGDRLRSFFHPRSWGTVYAYDGGDGRKAAYQVEKIDIDETGTVRAATISLICPDPKWYALEDQLTQLAVWQGKISFPLRLPPQINASGQSVTIMPDASITDYDKIAITGATHQLVTQQGKNLFGPKAGTVTVNGVTCTVDADGTITLNGTAANVSSIGLTYVLGGWNKHPLFVLNAGLSYVTSFTTISGSASGNASIGIYGDSSYIAGAGTLGSSSKLFTGAGQIVTLFYVSLNSGDSFTNYKFRFQIEQNSIATLWVPFIPDSPSPDYPAPMTGTTKITVSDGGSNSQVIHLPQTLYSLPDGAVDSYDVVSGKGTAAASFYTYMGSSSESWKFSSSASTHRQKTALFWMAGLSNIFCNGGNTLIGGFCDRFKIYNADQLYAGDNVGIAHDNYSIFISIEKSRLSGWSDSWTDDQKITAFKAWLSANPVTVLYPLATPQTITGTVSVPIYHPTTTLTLDAGTLSLRCRGKFTVTEKVNTLIGNVHNDSAVAMGLTVKFTATGTVVNPSLYDVNRYELMQINTTMHAGDVIIITTGDGNKRVKLISGDVTTNINNLMAYPPKWLKAYQGDNLFRYNADEGIDSLSVTILSTQAYWGA